MKNFCVALFAVLALTSVHAVADDSGPAADSMFMKLQAQFKLGTQADLKPLVGKIDSGRCFSYEAPDNPIASAAMVALEIVDNGPLGSGTPSFTMSVSAEPSLPVGYYDQASVHATDSNIDQTHLTLISIDAKTYQMNLSNGSSMQFRQVGTNLVAFGKAAWGDASLMCYYFKTH